MYRTICCELWTDEKVQALSAHEKLLFLYLITNPHSHMSGIYYLPKAFIQHELNLGRGFDGVWMGLLQSGLIDADEKRSQVWVKNMLPYQARGHKAEKGVASHLYTLHSSPLLERFLAQYPQIVQYLSPDFIRCPIDTLSIPHGSSPYPVPDSDSSLSSLKSEEGEDRVKGDRGKRPWHEDLKPTEKHFEFGKVLQVNVGSEWGKFKNYCLAHDKRYANYEAAFRNWLVNAKEKYGQTITRS